MKTDKAREFWLDLFRRDVYENPAHKEILTHVIEHTAVEQLERKVKELESENATLQAKLKIARDALKFCAELPVWHDEKNQKIILTYGYGTEKARKAIEQLEEK